MTTGEYVTRAEFAMLHERVNSNEARLDTIDQSGTRGVGIVQQQLMDLKGDVTELRVRLEKHESEHTAEARDRRASRRWLIATAVAFLVAIEGPLAYVIVHIR